MIKLTLHDPFKAPDSPENRAHNPPLWIAWNAIGVVLKDWASYGGAIVQMTGDPHMHRVRETPEQIFEMRELARKREARCSS